MTDTSNGESLPNIHVVFGMSAAGTIGEALAQIGCRECVLACPDDLSFGPIDGPAAKARAAAIKEMFQSEWEEIVQCADLFELAA